MNGSIFKIAVLVYKFLHSSYPKYFVSFLKPRHTDNTQNSQADYVSLEVLHYATSVCKSTKHFDYSFAYDTPKT